MEWSLRDDSHNQSVQIAGTEIESELTKLIDEIEKTNRVEMRRKTRTEQALYAKTGRDPMQKSFLGGPILGSVIARKTPLERATDASWFKLPDAKRDQVIQSWGVEMPLRWKARIGAYFASIAAEEK